MCPPTYFLPFLALHASCCRRSFRVGGSFETEPCTRNHPHSPGTATGDKTMNHETHKTGTSRRLTRLGIPIVLAMLVLPTVAVADAVQWTEAEGGNGQWAVEDMGGHLATLTSEDESSNGPKLRTVPSFSGHSTVPIIDGGQLMDSMGIGMRSSSLDRELPGRKLQCCPRTWVGT